MKVKICVVLFVLPSSGQKQVSLSSSLSFIIITTGSLAVSVTDMTAPVVGSSGGVYALVSAHLANVVMVSFLCVCACVCVRVCRWLSHHSVVLSLQSIAASSKQPVLGPSRCCSIYRCHTFLTITISFSFSQSVWACAHVYVTACEEIPSRCTLTSMSALFDLNSPSCGSSQTH